MDCKNHGLPLNDQGQCRKCITEAAKKAQEDKHIKALMRQVEHNKRFGKGDLVQEVS